ncbi:hypothetical protein BS50DRAFT_640996 [Corynespora cassiicola Philippines]|uniref:Uncharacterized protein n=1 Tax=Corynespora cassiicola Philippines TaxID=1448308 RepID=A0A2T2N350_CORCC|nr:hypothetical protein BS50DRAFT_640996 [Corynespora cassiicola Philippines]
MKTAKPSVTALLVFLGLVAFFFKVLPGYTTATDSILTSLASKLHESISAQSMCTEDVGIGHCCEIYSAAEPCLDECRKNHLDRQTFALTKEYDQCASTCLGVYRATCKKEEALKGAQIGWANKLDREIRHIRRGWRNRT